MSERFTEYGDPAGRMFQWVNGHLVEPKDVIGRPEHVERVRARDIERDAHSGVQEND